MINIDKLLLEVKLHFSKNTPVHLTYHDWGHTLSVYRNVQHIGKKEKLKDKEIYLLKIAALFHDIGYLESKIEHEKRSCDIMEEWLKPYTLPTNDLNSIKGMIMSTKIPQTPNNLLQKIIGDADLLYLGTSKYQEVSKNLYLEFQFYYPDLNQQKWNEIQFDFLSSHIYHTTFCRKYYQLKKQKHLTKIIANIKSK